MSEKDITKSWKDPDEAPSLDRDWFARAEIRDGDKVVRRGRPKSDNSKQAISLRLDADVVEWFKQSGSGWQTRMNEALRKMAGL
ncbi:MAG: hypothetical protein DI606_04495 [Sphingobium sp.]|uniref:BrnA antitoxin family protein n=1 Tax=Sphingobium sp. TaxID=1912891 RepID=UPI000DB69F03|nr:BrnA antitoxin family protein [Sphingobium sp.]PZU13831.1 MAG: hypothetical protein DI606_04495 [Sphingobium sp.]